MEMDKLPKIDLHCHLDGSLPFETVREQIEKEITLKMIQVENNCKSLTEYLEKFEFLVECLQTKQGLVDGAYSFMKDISHENMKYIEVRFAPMLSVHEKLNCKKVIEAVLEGLEKGKKEFGIKYNVITCAMRHHSIEQNFKMLSAAKYYLNNGVCAIDLAGDESIYPNHLFKELFHAADKVNIPFVIHSGETGSIENVRSAVELGAVRIGHGIALQKDKELMHEVAKRNIGIEMCPTSNIQTGAVKSWSEYPMKEFLDAGIKVCVNTDNRMVSNTNMTKELKLIHRLYKDDNLIKKVLINAAETAFDEEIRNWECWLKI